LKIKQYLKYWSSSKYISIRKGSHCG
jgi:hypothetical protein